MAEGGKDFISSIQRELECGICLDEITNAKLLQCLHTFCEKCLETLNKHGEISCPICRATTPLSEQGVRGLASNRFVNRITELVQAQRGSSTSGVSFCGNCDAGRVIKFYCFDCKHFLCEPCTDAHNKMKLFFQGHQAVQLDNFSSKDCYNFVGNQAKCRRHNKEELRFYCKDCDECICRDCTVVEHRNHDCLHIEDAAAKQTEAIQNKVTRVEDCFNILDARCKLLDESSSVLKKEAEKAKSDMKAICDLLIQNIKKHLEEKTNDIEKQTQDHLQVLSSQKETLLAERSKLRDSLSFNKAILNRGCFSEIMELKQVLNDRIDELECSIQRQIEPSIKLLHIHCETDDNDNTCTDAMISQIGKIRFYVSDLSIPKAEETETDHSDRYQYDSGLLMPITTRDHCETTSSAARTPTEQPSVINTEKALVLDNDLIVPGVTKVIGWWPVSKYKDDYYYHKAENIETKSETVEVEKISDRYRYTSASSLPKPDTDERMHVMGATLNSNIEGEQPNWRPAGVHQQKSEYLMEKLTGEQDPYPKTHSYRVSNQNAETPKQSDMKQRKEKAKKKKKSAKCEKSLKRS